MTYIYTLKMNQRYITDLTLIKPLVYSRYIG